MTITHQTPTDSRLRHGDLRGHVPRRTGLAGHVVLDRPAPERPVDNLREAEIHELRRAGGGEADVVGLQVAVHQNAESREMVTRRQRAFGACWAGKLADLT